MFTPTDPSGIDSSPAPPIQKLPLGDVTERGCYYCHWSGHLLRKADDDHGDDGRAKIEIVARRQLLVTKLSDDPFMAARDARMRAAELDLNAGF